MKSITILQIIFDVILIALFGFSGFTGEVIDSLVALLSMGAIFRKWSKRRKTIQSLLRRIRSNGGN